MINNLTNENLKEIDELNDYIEYLFDYMNIKDAVMSVIIVDNKEIHRINKEYRNIDRETDVISFALEDGEKVKFEMRNLGDIYISLDKAKSQAKEYNHSLKRELCFLLTHGFLHLLGYDHMNKEDEEIMFNLQDEILNSYGVRREN
jgi:probable rRNA maturation factor